MSRLISLGSSLSADLMDLLQREYPKFQPEQEWDMGQNGSHGEQKPQYLLNG